jgi:primosomal protein N' (replication factor Y)
VFAEVVLARVSRGLDKAYHYSIPDELHARLKVGHQVRVPFGFRNETGYVVGFVEQAEVKKVKDIFEVTSEIPLFTEQSVELARWLASYYFSFFITALRLVMPPGTKGKEGKKQKASNKKLPEVSDNIVAASGNRGVPTSTSSSRDPDRAKASIGIQPQVSGLTLTEEQQQALDKILTAIKIGKTEKFLLYGVTGSGKTEVYLQAIAEIIGRGKSAIVMVPEISLTPQLTQRFRDRFQDHIAVLHSEFTQKQRVSEWKRVAAGEADIVLGTRSALFAPLKNPGLIVIDEEYETTYKSEKSPRYHTREVALKLAERHNAVVIMGSATPSVETFYKAESGAYTRLNLPKRIDNRPLPPVEVVDMREEIKANNFSVLSAKLRAQLGKTLAGGEQAILFINRLGFFTFIMCRACGYVIECPRCSISLIYSSRDKKLRCNRCNFSSGTPATCPRCNSAAIKYFGTGTQRIEDEVAKIFPTARILRYDRDTTGKRGSHEIFFKTFAEGQADILIGTQMVTKGLDVARVTLVGVVSADIGLHLPDFRSAEHTFQLLTQVAGRAGRHHLPGRVIIQTYSPQNYALQAAAKHAYEDFYYQEIEHRRELNYPPFSKLISLLVSGSEKEKVSRLAEELGKFLKHKLGNSGQVLGPAAAIIAKLRGHWRFRLLLKGSDLDALRKTVAETLSKIIIPAEIKVMIDVEPMSLL